MCGILGAVGPSASRLKDRIDQALKSIAHRGPDASGQFVAQDESCWLAHQRLSILDLSADANQPMVRDRVALTYNGEIYNHQKLRKTFFKDEAHSLFKTHGDTETLIELYRKLGIDCLPSLQGMFAGAIYDERLEKGILFRDTSGIKSIYYTVLADSTWVFASEIKALVALGALVPKVSIPALALYLSYENYPQETSLFQNVHQLGLGEVIELVRDARGVIRASHSVYQPRMVIDWSKLTSPTEMSEWVRALLEQSVREHLLSDVPIGITLSGGIDSSLVAHFAAKEGKDLMGFTGYFDVEDRHYDESLLSQTLADTLKFPLEKVLITPRDFENNFDSVVWALDEPKMGMGSFSQYMVAKRAAQHRKVLLTGHGGDEYFGGYPLFRALYLIDKGLFSRESRNRLRQLDRREWPWILYTLLSAIQGKPVQFAPVIWPYAKFANVYQSEIGDLFQKNRTFASIRNLEVYYRTLYLPGLLNVEDKISMAHSIESRVPLLGEGLIQMASIIPPEVKLDGGELKSILRKIATDVLPEAHLRAPKRGFPTPLRLWFRKELQTFVKERLLDHSSRLHDFIDKKDLEKLIQNFKKPHPIEAIDERRAHRIWMALNLESWLRQFSVL